VCSSYFAGKNRPTSTKEESLSKAKEIAEDGTYSFAGNSAPLTTDAICSTLRTLTTPTLTETGRRKRYMKALPVCQTLEVWTSSAR